MCINTSDAWHIDFYLPFFYFILLYLHFSLSLNISKYIYTYIYNSVHKLHVGWFELFLCRDRKFLTTSENHGRAKILPF